jgi:hypothetical protein
MAALGAIVFSLALTDERTLQLLLTSLCLVAALLAAAIVVAWVNRWRRKNDALEDLSPTVQMVHFRALYEKGEISQEEFERLRALLNARMREALGVPAPDKKEQSPPDAKPMPAPPETGIQRRDGPDTGIRPA